MKALDRFFLFIVVGAVLFWSGCVTKRIVWSPDGSKAFVLSDQGLHLCDKDGNLSPMLVESVSGAVWHPDGKRLILSKILKFATWKDFAGALTAEQQKQIEHRSQLLTEKIHAGKSWEEANSELKAQENLIDNELRAVHLNIRDQNGALLRDKMGAAFDSLTSLEVEASALFVGQVLDNKVELGARRAVEPAHIWELRITAGGEFVAYATFPDNENKTSLLYVLPLDGSVPARLVAPEAACFPDWSTDGKSLVYFQAIGKSRGADELRLGALVRHRVVNNANALEVDPAPESLAGLLFSEFNKVRCLKDGRILFSSFEIQLPATRLDMPQRQQLFVIEPERQLAVVPLISRAIKEQVPEELSYFEVSPDEKRIAIADNKGRVFVLTPLSGQVEALQKVESNLTTIPVWRNADELTFIMPNQGLESSQPSRNEVVVWNGKISRAMSKNWPEEVRKGLVDH